MIHVDFKEDFAHMRFRRYFGNGFLPAVLTIFLLSGNARAEAPEGKTNDAGIDGAFFSGVSVLKNRGSSYTTKTLPVIGVAFIPYYSSGPALELVCEVSFHHTFRSNYDNYFYYSSHQSFSIIPGIHLYFLTKGTVSGILQAGAGFTHTFSNYIAENYYVACGGLGIKFNDSRINNLFVSYRHSFVSGLKYYENIQVYIEARIWNKH
jgi:hypothetical protein